MECFGENGRIKVLQKHGPTFPTNHLAQKIMFKSNPKFYRLPKYVIEFI